MYSTIIAPHLYSIFFFLHPIYYPQFPQAFSSGSLALAMVLVLAIGDFHIPHRSPSLAQRFKTLLLPGKIQYILCTGNLCTPEIDAYLHSISPDVHIVSGDMDSISYPGKVVVNIGILSFGVCHGHQIMPTGSRPNIESLRREMGVDVLITGHTQALDIWQGQEGGLYINPGSATGAFTTTNAKVTPPSFVLMDVQGSKVVTYSYVLDEKETGVRVDREAFDRAI